MDYGDIALFLYYWPISAVNEFNDHKYKVCHLSYKISTVIYGIYTRIIIIIFEISAKLNNFIIALASNMLLIYMYNTVWIYKNYLENINIILQNESYVKK